MDGRLTLAALLVAFLAWFGLLVHAWPGWEGMNPASGSIAACADAALHGESPGSGRGTAFIATTHFPPVPLLVAGARGTGMSWRAALRWVNLLSTLALIAAVALCSQALGGGGVAMTVALSVLLVSFPFVRASLSGRADALAAALSIAALAAWCWDPRRRGWAAPALAAATWLVQPTSFTVPLAVMISAFAPGARRGAGPFAARFVAATAAGVVLTMPWRGLGWYGDALYSLVFSPPNTSSLLRGPFEFLRFVASYAELAVIGGLAYVYLTSEWSRGRPIRPFAIASLAIAMLALTNRGADEGRLLEIIAMASVAAGLWAEHATRREASLGVALVLLVVGSAAWRESRAVDAGTRAPGARRGEVIAMVKNTPGEVVCEDPLIALSAGRRPEVSDAALLRTRLGKRDPRARAIVDRLDQGHYALVVLDADLATERDKRYRDAKFGAAAAAAIADRYERRGEVDGYSIYGPRVLPIPQVPEDSTTIAAPAETEVAPRPAKRAAASRRSR